MLFGTAPVNQTVQLRLGKLESVLLFFFLGLNLCRASELGNAKPYRAEGLEKQAYSHKLNLG